MAGGPLRIVQISDIHLFSDPEKSLLGVKTQESFTTLVDLIATDHPDMLLLTGDLSQDGTVDTYIRLADLLSVLSVPIYFVPGNHDDVKVMNRVFPRGNISTLRQIIWKNWQLILLDSQKPGAVEGYLDESQFKFLQSCLESRPDLQAIVSFHHQPVPVGCQWLDRLGILNADALWDLLARYPQVKTIIFGHVHQQHEGEKNGVKYYSSPSTCIQFKTQSAQFALEKLPPAYRWIELHEDGKLETGVVRAPEYVGTFDVNAKGY